MHPSHLACCVHSVLFQEFCILVEVTGRGGGAENVFGPLAVHAVDKVGEILAHAINHVEDERHASANLANRDGLCVLFGLIRDASVDDATRVDVGVMHDVELASDEVPCRDARPVKAMSAWIGWPSGPVPERHIPPLTKLAPLACPAKEGDGPPHQRALARAL